MKKVLPQTSVLLIYILWVLLSPLEIYAQCSCSGGTPATMEQHIVTLPATNQSNTTISFPKFDPAIGILTCVRLDDTLSIVSSTGIRNYDPIETEYEFQLTINTKIDGPSLTRTNFKNVQYGPDILDAYGSPGDSITYGPDTVYNNWPSNRTNTTNMTPYLGATGTVDFVYTIGGGVIAVGGANYNAQVRTTTWGTFKLTYFWCPNAVLASGVRNLNISKDNDLVKLSWEGPDNASKTNFKIETSTDGKTFSDLKQGTGTNFITGASAKYQYQYHLDRPIDRKLYFRVAYTVNQQVKYSETRWLLPDEITARSLAVYPNPAIRTLKVLFGEEVSGGFDIELRNHLGQRVYYKSTWIKNAKQMEVDVNDPPPPGIYFIKAKSLESAKVYTGKLLFTR